MAPFLDALPGVAEDINTLSGQANALAQAVNAAAAAVAADKETVATARAESELLAAAVDQARGQAVGASTTAVSASMTATNKAAEASGYARDAKLYAENAGVMPAMRDTLGVFPGVIQPALNLFAPAMTTDTVPIGTFSRSTGAFRMGQTGFLEWVAADRIRRDWDADGNLLGWLLEGPKTNFLPNCLTFGGWTTAGCSFVQNSYTAPDNTLTMGKLSEDASSGQHYLMAPDSLIGNIPMTASIYADPDERSVFAGVLSDTVTSVIEARFDLSNNSVSIPTIMAPWTDVSAKIKSLRDGRRRCILTATKGQGASASFLVYPISGGLNSYLGAAGSGLGLWGAQLEEGSFDSSLRSTAATATTRPADSWVIPVSSFPFNSSQGTFFVKARTAPGLPPSEMNQVLFVLNDGSWNNALYVARGSTGLLKVGIFRNGAPSVLNLGAVQNDTDIKLVVCFNKTKIKACLDGFDVFFANISLPDSLSSLYIGRDALGNEAWFGHLSHLAEFPYEKSDSSMQAISS
jgi:hypothetical protein